MSRFPLLLIVFLAVIGSANAQLYIMMKGGPFYREKLRADNPANIEAKISDPDLIAEEYNFQLYVQDGAGIRTLQSQIGSQWWLSVNLFNIPSVPEPQISVAARVRHKYSGAAYILTATTPIQIFSSDLTIKEVQGWDQTDTFTPLIVGQPQAGIYGIRTMQPKRTREIIYQFGPRGDTIKRKEVVGNPYITQATLDTVFDMKWPGARRLRATVFYEGGSSEGYTVEKSIPDSIPVPNVDASLGFGPFKSGVDQLNSFVVRGLGPMCDSVIWTVQYETDNGLARTPVRISRPYDSAKDSMHLVLNMRDVSPKSVLTATAKYGPFLPEAKKSFPLMVAKAEPHFRISGILPIKPGDNGIDTVTVDSLPPRTLNVKMILSSGSGSTVREVNVSRIAPAHIRSASIPVDRRSLSLGTYVVRVRALNEFKDDGPDYFYGFDVRDTSKFFLVADSWGPFTRGDSATITPAIIDVRPVVGPKPDRVLGRFTLIDTLNPTRPLYVSVPVDLSGVRSRDSAVHCPDSSYVFGDTRYRRVRLQTSSLPFSCHVRFERLIVRGSDTTRDQIVEHPIFTVPSPGRLTTIPRLDTAFTVTRNQPLTMTLSDIVPEATAVRFAIYGTKDPDPVIEQIVSRAPGQSEVTCTVDAGLLPVNAKVFVSVVTSLANAVGATIRRTINTVPDTLSVSTMPSIGNLMMDWSRDSKTKLITGVDQFRTKLTFTKIPAQTRSIEVLSYDDLGGVIDSVSFWVPYKTKYDPSLKIDGDFVLRTFNTASLQVRYLSDGGPDGGLRYNFGISTGQYRPGKVTVEKMNLRSTPPTVDNTPILQGSDDVVALTMRWSQYNTTDPSGYSASLKIDSVRMEIRDCAGNVLDRALIMPHPAVQSGGIIADTLYPVRKLPLSASQVIFRLYSKSMTLPTEGIVYSAPISLQTNPIVNIPLGTSYPSYRVNDTIQGELKQEMTITNIDGVTYIGGLELINERDRSTIKFPLTLVPSGDTIRVPAFDFNSLTPGDTYRLAGTAYTATCSRVTSTNVELAKISVPRIAGSPAKFNWIYSSKGWGPFKQGRAPQTQVVASLNPTSIVGRRSVEDLVGDDLEISIVGWSALQKTFTKETIQRFSFPKSELLPDSIRVREVVNLTPFDTTSFIAIHLKWTRRYLQGQYILDTMLRYPVRMLPFPDQLIEAETEGYEQSVLAGSSGPKVMEDLYDFTMRPQSSSIRRLYFKMLSTTGNVLDTFSIVPVSKNTADSTSLFQMKRDVAQYPWPYIARERERVNIEIGYLFDDAVKPTKIQKTSISILPRAEWLNGNVASLDGTATQTSVPIKVSIPLPSSWYEVNAPLFDTVAYGIGYVDPAKTLDQTIRATYNPETRQFKMVSKPPSGSFITPSLSLFNSGKIISYSTVAGDNEKSGEFTALYRFERSPLADNSDTVDNRELRIRSLYTSNYGGVVGTLRWIKGLMGTISKIAKIASGAATGGLLWVEPTFGLDASIKHLSTINIGTEREGSLLHLSEAEPPSKNTEKNEFPTSQAMALTIAGGGGIDVSFIGLLGLGVGVSMADMFGSGTTFANSVNERTSVHYSTAQDVSLWFNIELSLLWGIVKVELFSGRFAHIYDPRLMPSFLVFSESIGSIFKGGYMEKRGEATQNVEPLGKLPTELPHYRPSPSLDASQYGLVSVHLEQSILGSNGRLVLSSLDTTTHSLVRTAVIADNRQGIHDPTVTLCGTGGSAFIGWAQSGMVATSFYYPDNAVDLLEREDAYVAFYDAAAQQIQTLSPPNDDFRRLSEGSPVIAVSADTVNAMMAWLAMADDNTYTDVFVRPIVRDSGRWSFGATRLLYKLPGVDRDIQIRAMNDGAYVASWLNDDLSGEGVSVISATISKDGTSSITRVTDVLSGIAASELKMVGNGKEAAILFSSSVNTDDSEYNRSLVVARYQDGVWSDPESIDVGRGQGILRHVEGDLNEDGSFFVMIDAFDSDVGSNLSHKVAVCVGSLYDSPSRWKVFTNSTVASPADREIWAMSAAIGPNQTLYVATQELDSLRDNQQAYGTGLPLGPSRCNAVIRAFQLDGNGEVINRPFGNTPTSADETLSDKLEATLRYRIQVLDPAPNPSREACVVPLAVQKPTQITMRVVDELGRDVLTVYEGLVEAGIQGVSFETSTLNSGHYTVVVTDEVGVAGSAPLVVIH